MIRATTPPQKFRFRVDPETRFVRIQVTYMQGGNIVLVKNKSDMTFTNDGPTDRPYVASYNLTQEETKLFRGNLLDEQGVPDVFIQVRTLDTDGKSRASVPKRVIVYDVLNDEELSAEDSSSEEDGNDDT